MLALLVNNQITKWITKNELVPPPSNLVIYNPIRFKIHEWMTFLLEWIISKSVHGFGLHFVLTLFKRHNENNINGMKKKFARNSNLVICFAKKSKWLELCGAVSDSVFGPNWPEAPGRQQQQQKKTSFCSGF